MYAFCLLFSILQFWMGFIFLWCIFALTFSRFCQPCILYFFFSILFQFITNITVLQSALLWYIIIAKWDRNTCFFFRTMLCILNWHLPAITKHFTIRTQHLHAFTLIQRLISRHVLQIISYASSLLLIFLGIFVCQKKQNIGNIMY